MRDSWQQRIDRAAHLAERDAAARPLLQAYGRLLGLQRNCYETLRQRADRLTGSLDRDLGAVRPCIPPILSAVTTMGPPPLAEDARRILDGAPTAIDALLLAGWHAPANQPFFPKIVL